MEQRVLKAVKEKGQVGNNSRPIRITLLNRDSKGYKFLDVCLADPKRTQMPAKTNIPSKTISHHRWRIPRQN